MATTELIFKALGDGTRQRLLQVLSLHELSVSELVEVLEQPQSTVSRHLKVLNEAGLLADRRSGTAVMYSARPRARLDLTGAGASLTAGSPGSNGMSSMVSLRDQLLEWLAHEELADDVRDRLERIVRRRQADPTRFFDGVGAKWDQLRIEAFGDRFHFEALAVLLPRTWTVADIGTGTGHLLPMLAGHFRRVIAVDPAAGMLEVARSRPGVTSADNVEFREGSLADLPLADGEVDLAIASLVLHHVDRPARAIGELRRCLRGGGRLVIIEQQAHRNADFHDRMGDRWWGFTPAKLERWLRRAGFVDVEARPLTTARPTGRDKIGAPRLFVVAAGPDGPVSPATEVKMTPDTE